MNITYVLVYLWYESADPRTRDWAIVSAPWIIPLVMITYLFMVLEYGPEFMKNRTAFSLKWFIKGYNFLQIVANGLIIYNIFTSFDIDASIFCDPIVYSWDPDSYKLAEIMWWILILKILDCVETIIFVMRKKSNQVSFLHVYHHVSTVFLQWYVTRYISGTMSASVHAVNSIIHVIMYTYYLLSSMGPKVQMFVAKWKSLITAVQIVQFWGLILYCIQAFRPSCDFPKFPLVIVILDLGVNFALFYNVFHENSMIKPGTACQPHTDTTRSNL